MKDKGKKLAAVLILVAIAITGIYDSAKTAENAKFAEPYCKRISSQINQSRNQSEKRKAFEKELAEKKVEFERRYNEVKQRNDANKRKFEQCKEVSDVELFKLLARELSKHKAGKGKA